MIFKSQLPIKFHKSYRRRNSKVSTVKKSHIRDDPRSTVCFRQNLVVKTTLTPPLLFGEVVGDWATLQGLKISANQGANRGLYLIGVD